MTEACLDSDTLSEVLRRVDPQTMVHAARYLRAFGHFTISAMTRFEILRWLLAKNATSQLVRFRAFCHQTRIISIDEVILDRAAELWTLAGQLGKPRGDADLIIAATASIAGCRLITGNTAHFDWVPGLIVEDWRQP